ncbi:MAG: TlpA disulfide reductase family protein [Armatimonadota bacterium]|nr:TlpA disulfide reductase family protein [Armatimonadota bacterium]
MRAAVIVLLACLCLVSAADTEETPQPLAPGTEAPQFTATTLEGTPIKLAEWKGKVAVLNFFITWYRDAGKHLAMLEELADRYSQEGMRLLSISLDEDEEGLEQVRALIREQEIAHPVASDLERRISKLYHVRALPAIFIIGRDGKITHYHEGYTEGDDRRLEEAVTAALGVECPPAEKEQPAAEEEQEEPVCHCFRRGE